MASLFSRQRQSIAQFDSPAGGGGLVDRLDERDGLASLAAIDHGLPLLANRLHEVGQLPGVIDVRDRRRIARTARGADLLGEALPKRVVFRRWRLELPALHVLLLHNDRTAVAMYRDRLGQAGPDAGGRLDDAEGAVRET